MSMKIKKLLRFIPALVIMLVIFFFSAQTGTESTAVSDGVISAAAGEENVDSHLLTVIVRKSAHFLEYAALGAAIYFGMRGVGTDKKQGKRLLLSALFGALYAVSDELHQYFVPGRACMVTDMLIDACGAVCGPVLLLFVINAAERFMLNMKLGQKQ
ncbi:MAG: VanZ family protein [Huintestinicola sp.]|uniref:VanZ family protein n=1 Tax=Huintestinicola sp. TaxID=2981661 RepID=UPI003F09D922